MTNRLKGVPPQEEGGKHNTQSEKCFENSSKAAEKYPTLYNRLLNINAWQEYGGGLTAGFNLFDAQGQPKNNPELGDFVRIDIPGLGSKAGDGYDWVRITQLDANRYEKDERFFMQFVPSVNPTDPFATDIAHFYKNKATSNFIISRLGRCITVEIYGRNEVVNLETHRISDKLRNALVAFMGNIKLSKLQWKSLAEGLLNF